MKYEAVKTTRSNQKTSPCSMIQVPRLKKSGFTLIEILIASAIFAGVMVMVAGIVSQSTTYQAKIQAMRETADDARKITDLITNDVRNAKGNIAIPISGRNFSSGIMLLNCNAAGSCATQDDATAESSTANTLVVFSSDSYKIYTSQGDPNVNAKVYAISKTSVAPNIEIPDIATTIVTMLSSNNYLVSRSSYATSVTFTGFAPDDSHWSSQPYAEFTVTSKTPNYDSMPLNKRAIMTLQSSVALRNYK